MTARLLLLCLALAALTAGEATRPAFFNQKVSTRTVALNQPVRLELTTVPRQIESVNIEAAIADAITLGGMQSWRLVGKPSVQTDEKTRTVRVSIVLLPRQVGEIALPIIPVCWLNGEQVAEFGAVKIESNLLIGSESHPLPSELSEVAGFAWGSRLEEIKDKVGTTTPDGDRILAKVKPGLELGFRRGELVEAQIDAGNLSLDEARASFLARWGSPQIEESGSITWILGWTRIIAAPSPDGKGMRISLAREDLLARMTKARITDSVFGLLEGK